MLTVPEFKSGRKRNAKGWFALCLVGMTAFRYQAKMILFHFSFNLKGFTEVIYLVLSCIQFYYSESFHEPVKIESVGYTSYIHVLYT